MKSTVVSLIMSYLKHVLLDGFRYAKAFLTVTRRVVDEILSIDKAETMTTENVVRWLCGVVGGGLGCIPNQIKNLAPVKILTVGCL